MIKVKKRKINNILFVSALFLVLVVALKYLTTVNKQSTNLTLELTPVPPETTSELYSSELGFTIQIPSGYSVERYNSYIKLNNSVVAINISRNGTNFGDLKSYLKWFDSTRKEIVIHDEQNTLINQLSVVVREEELKNKTIKQKVYYLFTKGIVFTITSSSNVAYSDLDQIAQSFKYTP